MYMAMDPSNSMNIDKGWHDWKFHAEPSQNRSCLPAFERDGALILPMRNARSWVLPLYQGQKYLHGPTVERWNWLVRREIAHRGWDGTRRESHADWWGHIQKQPRPHESHAELAEPPHERNVYTGTHRTFSILSNGKIIISSYSSTFPNVTWVKIMSFKVSLSLWSRSVKLRPSLVAHGLTSKRATLAT